MWCCFLAFLQFVNLPVINLRETPSKNAEVVSQVAYGDEVDVLNEENGWQWIKASVDGYEGWIEAGGLVPKKELSARKIKIQRLLAHVYDHQDTIYGPILTLPFETSLELLQEIDGPQGRWLQVRLLDEREVYIQRGDVSFDFRPLSREEIVSLSYFFVNLPYTWGGKTSFGFDCSGFVQMLYRQMGVAIPRNSGQQCIWEGFKEISREELVVGDLIFWGLTPGCDKIRHVGMYIGEGEFIHTSPKENKPWLRYSHLDDHEWNGSGTYPYRHFRKLIQQ